MSTLSELDTLLASADPGPDEPSDASYRVTAKELRSFMERAERLEAEKKAVADEQKEVFAEAKSRGYDVPTLKKVIQLRKKDANAVSEEEALLELYKEVLGL